MTHEQAVELLKEDFKAAAPELTAAMEQARDLHIVLRDLPGGDFCWMVMELKPGDRSRALWSKEVPFESLPKVFAHFKGNRAFDIYFRDKVRKSNRYLTLIRARLGVTLTIEEASR